MVGLLADQNSPSFDDAEGEAVASDFKFQRIAQRGGSERTDKLAVSETHFQ